MDHIGIDVHKKESQICILADGGERIERRRLAESYLTGSLCRQILRAAGARQPEVSLNRKLGTDHAHERTTVDAASGRRLRRIAWLFLAGGIVLVAGRGDAARVEYVISFDHVVVDRITEPPEIAHLDLPGMARPMDSAEKGDDKTKQEEERLKPLDQRVEPSPRVIRRSPDALPSLAVASGPNNPSFVQAGFVVEAFWAVRTGTPDAYMKSAHFHPPDLSSGFEAQHLGHPNELHGIMIRSLDRSQFGLKRLRYRVTRNRQLPNKPLSIEGFSNYNVSVLVARSYDPRVPIRAQFVPFPVGLPVGNDPKLPWWTLPIFGFELVDQVYIASSASVDFDNIVLTRIEPASGPTGRREEDR